MPDLCDPTVIHPDLDSAAAADYEDSAHWDYEDSEHWEPEYCHCGDTNCLKMHMWD